MILENIALIGLYWNNLETQIKVNECVQQAGIKCGMESASSVSGSVSFYCTIVAFTFVFYNIYKKWIYNKHLVVRVLFDFISIPLIFLIIPSTIASIFLYLINLL